MDQQCSQVDIAALADPEQAAFIAATVLPRREPQGRGHLPTLAVVAGIPNRGYQGRGDQRADPAQLLQPLRHRVIAGHHFDLSIQARQTFFKLPQLCP